MDHFSTLKPHYNEKVYINKSYNIYLFILFSRFFNRILKEYLIRDMSTDVFM